jgi:choline dehydrogenase
LTDLIASVRLTREIIDQKAFEGLRGDEKLPGRKIQSDKEIGEWIKETCETEYHPSSSNKMGAVSSNPVTSILFF